MVFFIWLHQNLSHANDASQTFKHKKIFKACLLENVIDPLLKSIQNKAEAPSFALSYCAKASALFALRSIGHHSGCPLFECVVSVKKDLSAYTCLQKNFCLLTKSRCGKSNIVAQKKLKTWSSVCLLSNHPRGQFSKHGTMLVEWSTQLNAEFKTDDSIKQSNHVRPLKSIPDCIN